MDIFPSHDGSLQDSSQAAPTILGTPTSVSEDFPPTSSAGGGSLDIDKIFKELLLLCT